MSDISGFDGLISALGGAARAATLTGVRRKTVQAMLDRKSIAPEHWVAFADAASREGLRVSLSDFSVWRAACRRAGTSQPKTLEQVSA